MGELIAPVITTGRVRDLAQPELAAGDLVLRPWTPGDVAILVGPTAIRLSSGGTCGR